MYFIATSYIIVNTIYGVIMHFLYLQFLAVLTVITNSCTMFLKQCLKKKIITKIIFPADIVYKGIYIYPIHCT